MTDHTLLIGHPSTRVGMISQNLRNYSASTGRRLASDTTPTSHLRRDNNHHQSKLHNGLFKEPITVTDTPSIEINLGPFTLEFLPRDWWIDLARRVFDSSHGFEQSKTEEALEAFARPSF